MSYCLFWRAAHPIDSQDETREIDRRCSWRALAVKLWAQSIVASGVGSTQMLFSTGRRPKCARSRQVYIDSQDETREEIDIYDAMGSINLLSKFVVVIASFGESIRKLLLCFARGRDVGWLWLMLPSLQPKAEPSRIACLFDTALNEQNSNRSGSSSSERGRRAGELWLTVPIH